MAQEFKLPALGENVESGDIVKILVSEGESVEVNDPVLELETDKAVIEVPSSVSGVVTKIHVQEGQTAKVGDRIFSLEAASETSEAAPAEPAPKPEADEADKARPDQEPETEPAAEAGQEPVSQPASQRPEPQRREQEQERGARRGEVVDFTRAQRPAAAPVSDKAAAPAAPSVRRLAREIGVDINQVQGSGPRGRISTEDVKAYARQLNSRRTAAAPALALSPLPDFTRYGEIRREGFSNVRRATARHMAECWSTIPHVTQYDKADITELEALRKQFGSRVEKEGGKLTVTAILLKVLASALKNFPKFNASLDVESEEIIFKQYYHIGVAVDTPRGLLVPVLRDVDRKNLIRISVELSGLAEKARSGKISPDDLQGGTFTVTNLGGLGGTYFSPIVNLPEVAILGISRAAFEPVYRNGQFEPRLMLPLSLSYDHRLIDGADAVRFLRWVIEALETPFILSLEG